jgi:hypothetical protein
MVHAIQILLFLLNEGRVVLEALIALLLVYIRLDQIVQKRLRFDAREGLMSRRLAKWPLSTMTERERRSELGPFRMLWGWSRRLAIRLAKVFVR